MCGIAGILNPNPNDTDSHTLILRMISILQHRGPDESGAYIDPVIHMGHARLAVLGLENGTQPISNEDETLWIIFNGEVFNYIELKESLVQKGHCFKTDTDTEVIIHLYEEMGPRCLSLLNGQFAIAIWDSRQQELFLARDRVGICPLYYTVQSGRFLFASEIKALFLDPDVPRQIDPVSLAQVFTCWTTIGTRTIFENVFELSPGHYMCISADSLLPKQIPYWHLPSYPYPEQWAGTREAAEEELCALLEDAVALRLRADVPVGAYLSGGLDSSIITSIVSSRFNNRLETFSMGFAEAAFDEGHFQALMAEFLGTDHHQVNISNHQVRETLGRVIRHCEKPLLRTSPVPLYLLSQLVRESGFKVVLTGEGADEVFGGYNIFKEAKVRAFWGKMPASTYRPRLLERLYPYVFDNPARSRAYLQKFFAVDEKDMKDPFMSHRKRWDNTEKCTTFFSPALRASLEGRSPLDDLQAHLPPGFSDRELFSRAQWLEMSIFMSNYLLSSQGDRVAMANSVELRVPFLDHRVIELAAQLPPSWKINGLNEKYLLKAAFRDNLPAKVVKRPKQPYRAPIGQAFFHAGMSLDDLVDMETLERANLFDGKKVRHFFEKHIKQGRGPAGEVNNMAVAGIVSTQAIYEQFIEGFPQHPVLPLKPDKMIIRNSDSRLPAGHQAG